MFGRLMISILVAAAVIIFGSIQMLPYPPEPTITAHTFMKKTKVIEWEMIDRTHKSDRRSDARRVQYKTAPLNFWWSRTTFG